MRRTWKAAAALFRIRVAEGMQYRMAAASGATIGVFWGLIEVVILSVFFRYGNQSAGSFNGLGLFEGVSYIWLAQLLVVLQLPGIDKDLLTKITNGDIGVELCRPLDLYWHWFSRSAAGKVTDFVVRGTLVVLCAAAFTRFGAGSIGLHAPASPLHFCLFLLSVLGAFVFSTAYGMFLTAIRVGVDWGDGPINLIAVAGSVLSGSYLPLQLWPDFMQSFLRLQPFASYLDTPARLYVGSVSLQTGLLSLLTQVVWIAVFLLLGKWIMYRKIKTVIVQGG